jgi:hypothetical protein
MSPLLGHSPYGLPTRRLFLLNNNLSTMFDIELRGVCIWMRLRMLYRNGLARICLITKQADRYKMNLIIGITSAEHSRYGSSDLSQSHHKD